jgi:glycosyltransferase involved in cell wall biosynthesis
MNAPAEPVVLPRAERADIALLLEGTYPYVSGGVSSWVHQIIRGFPELTFAVIFVGSRAQDYGKMKYELPANVVHAEVHYLYDDAIKPEVEPAEGDPEMFKRIERLHDYFRTPDLHRKDAGLLGEIAGELGGKLGLDQFLYSEASWDYVKKQYRRFCTDPSFVDYFWTVRIMHGPIWVLAKIADGLLPVRAFHTVSTGFAGFLGALAKRRYGKPLILSEHGIYTKERKIDLFSAQWIADNRSVFQRDPTELSYFRQMWIRFFEALGRTCYDACDTITALYEVNRLRQVADGADPAKTRNIPNGINLAAFAPLRAQRPADPPPVACLIGRVVPIKDVKTFVRAMRTVANRLPEAQGWIAGPEDEAPDYAAECRALVENLGLQDNVKFLGFQKLTELMPKLGLVVLSSISEGLPLVILEGYAAGVPTVSTDVGSCRQLIEGLDDEDRALGASGRVVGIADPPALAAMMLELLTDTAQWKAASEAGIRRVEKYYAQDIMFARYREVYDAALAKTSPWPKGTIDA